MTYMIMCQPGWKWLMGIMCWKKTKIIKLISLRFEINVVEISSFPCAKRKKHSSYMGQLSKKKKKKITQECKRTPQVGDVGILCKGLGGKGSKGNSSGFSAAGRCG